MAPPWQPSSAGLVKLSDDEIPIKPGLETQKYAKILLPALTICGHALATRGSAATRDNVPAVEAVYGKDRTVAQPVAWLLDPQDLRLSCSPRSQVPIRGRENTEDLVDAPAGACQISVRYAPLDRPQRSNTATAHHY